MTHLCVITRESLTPNDTFRCHSRKRMQFDFFRPLQAHGSNTRFRAHAVVRVYSFVKPCWSSRRPHGGPARAKSLAPSSSAENGRLYSSVRVHTKRRRTRATNTPTACQQYTENSLPDHFAQSSVNYFTPVFLDQTVVFILAQACIQASRGKSDRQSSCAPQAHEQVHIFTGPILFVRRHFKSGY